MITRGERMLALRKRRMADAHPFFRGGFRPFFLGGGFWALCALTLWLFALSGAVTLPTHFDTLAWHRHEMLFGFVGAVIAGFLLTAIPNWTGRLPIAGTPLFLLFSLWLAARVAVLFSLFVGGLVAGLLDAGFFALMAALCAREVLAAKNRNALVVVLLLLFAIANAVDHAAMAGLFEDGVGTRAGIGLVILMISLIGGRIVPSFTRNWLVKQGEQRALPTQPGRFDVAVIAATALALAGWLFTPANPLVGYALMVAGAAQAVRLARWSGFRTRRDPLVLILHVGYAWVPVGLFLLGLSILDPAVPASGALHALTAGAMATMILAVMSRATLGHTGRELKASAATTAIFILVTVGAAGRVAAPLLPIDYMLAVTLAGTAWGAAFVLFLLSYGPKLIGPRPDGKA